MEVLSVAATQATFDSAMAACATANQWHWIVMLLDEMEERGLEPSGRTYRLAIRYGSSCLRVSVAFV